MAASNESLVLFKKRQKYCCDPFKEHISRRAKDGNSILVSDCNTHDTVAVYLFQKHPSNHQKANFQIVQKVIYFSDGCGGQYKNFQNFINLCNHQNDIGALAEWHCFCYKPWKRAV